VTNLFLVPAAFAPLCLCLFFINWKICENFLALAPWVVEKHAPQSSGFWHLPFLPFFLFIKYMGCFIVSLYLGMCVHILFAQLEGLRLECDDFFFKKILHFIYTNIFF